MNGTFYDIVDILLWLKLHNENEAIAYIQKLLDAVERGEGDNLRYRMNFNPGCCTSSKLCGAFSDLFTWMETELGGNKCERIYNDMEYEENKARSVYRANTIGRR